MSAYIYCVRDFNVEKEGKSVNHVDVPYSLWVPDFQHSARHKYEMGLVELGFTQSWDQLSEENIGFIMSIYGTSVK